MIRHRKAVIAIIFIFTSISAAEGAKSFLTVQDIFSGWQKNYGSLKSMKVSTTQDNTVEPSDSNYAKSTVKHTCIEITEADGKFRARVSSAPNCFNDINYIEEASFDGIHHRIFSPARKQGTIYAGLNMRHPGPPNFLGRFFLLEPEYDMQGIKSREPELSRTIKQASSDPNLMISVRPSLEEMAGQSCHVIDVNYLKKDKTWAKGTTIWFAHEKGMLPMKIQDFGEGGIVFRERAVEEIDFAKTNTGGLWYPIKMYELTNHKFTDLVKAEVTVTEFVPNIKVNPKIFVLHFPDGTQVGDTETGTSYTTGVTGAIEKLLNPGK